MTEIGPYSTFSCIIL